MVSWGSPAPQPDEPSSLSSATQFLSPCHVSGCYHSCSALLPSCTRQGGQLAAVMSKPLPWLVSEASFFLAGFIHGQSGRFPQGNGSKLSFLPRAPRPTPHSRDHGRPSVFHRRLPRSVWVSTFSWQKERERREPRTGDVDGRGLEACPSPPVSWIGPEHSRKTISRCQEHWKT